MPTLIRLVVILAVLVALAYGAMFALVAMVEPNEKEVTIRIPGRDLRDSPQREPLVRREIDTSRAPPAPSPVPTPAEPDATEAELAGEPVAADPPLRNADEDGSVVTLSPGTE